MDFRKDKDKQINLDSTDKHKPFNRYDKIEIEEIHYLKSQGIKFCSNFHSKLPNISSAVKIEENVSEKISKKRNFSKQKLLLIRHNVRFRDGTTHHQDSCSMAKKLFEKKRKNSKKKLAYKSLFRFVFEQFFSFSSKKLLSEKVFQNVFFKGILHCQNLKWENDFVKKKNMMKTRKT